MKKHRRIAALLMATVMAAGLAGCGSDAGKDSNDAKVETSGDETGNLRMIRRMENLRPVTMRQDTQLWMRKLR